MRSSYHLRIEYRDRILEIVRAAEFPVDVDHVRTEAGINNWESTKSILLELALERRIRAVRTNRGWLFYPDGLFGHDDVPLQQL